MTKSKIIVNGYTIRYNPFWQKWQVTHPEIGFVGEYRQFKDAQEDCIKG